MFCNECGAENVNGSKFCNNCGKQLHPVKIVPVERTEPPEFYKCYDELLHFNEKPAEAETPKEEKTVPEEEKPVEKQPVEQTPVTPAPVPTVAEVPTVKKKEEENPLSQLSTYKRQQEIKEKEDNEVKRIASSVLDPIEDDYWDDTLKEIDDEIYSIPKENLIKIIGSIVALFALIAWFIYML